MNDKLIQNIDKLKAIVEKELMFGAFGQNDEYFTLRKEIINEQKIKSKLPDWLKKCRNLSGIKDYFNNYSSIYMENLKKVTNDLDKIVYQLEFPDEMNEIQNLQEKNILKKEYFHIYISLKNNKKYFKWDETKENIIENIMKSFVKNNEIIIDGSLIKVEEISKVQIKSTEKNMKNLVYKRIDENEKSKQKSVNNFFANMNNINQNVYMEPPLLKDVTEITEFENISSENLFDILLKKYKLENQPSKIQSKIIENKIEITKEENNKVFIVHGHDIEMRETVARFIQTIELKAVILYEQSNAGKTIIEKIEENTDVRYGIVLYSPCDLGKSKKDEKLNKRPRQNVILEHGYLMGKLGRKNVIALTKEDLELPSDLLGIINLDYDSGGVWKIKLAKELKENGLKIDMNKAL